MSATHLRRRTIVAIATPLLIGAMLAGCARGTGEEAIGAPGITDSTITIGTTSPMSGSAAGVGTCAVDGAGAYFEARNADGGITFGDGKTRTVSFEGLDDGYDPQRALANYQNLTGDVFAMALSLGTPTNRAWREAAIADGVPQVLVQTGDPLFSDREESPMQLGLIPVYQQEGYAFGELLAGSGEEHRVAVLYQNDDFGEGYREGFLDAVESADNVEIVKSLTFEATDTDISAQITELASSDADILFNAMSSLAPLVIGTLQQADSVGWHPSIFLPSTSSSPAALLQPSEVADAFPAIYSTASSLVVGTPEFEADEDGKAFLEAMAEYTDQDGAPAFPQCVWSWIGASILEEAFIRMEEPTRESFMTALTSISDFDAPLLLPGGSIDTTVDGRAAMTGVAVQKYDGTSFATVNALE